MLQDKQRKIQYIKKRQKIASELKKNIRNDKIISDEKEYIDYYTKSVSEIRNLLLILFFIFAFWYR